MSKHNNKYNQIVYKPLLQEGEITLPYLGGSGNTPTALCLHHLFHLVYP